MSTPILPEDSEGYVYYLKLNTNKGTFYKIGFTRQDSVEKRFSYNGSNNYKLIEKVLMHKYSLYAYDIEQLLHSGLQKHKAYNNYGFMNFFRDLSLHPFFKDGQSELYKYDVLGLDSDKTSLFGLMRSNKTDLVRKRRLFFDIIFTDLKSKFEYYQESYNILDEFFEPPIIESKQQLIDRKGEWVISLLRWARRNAADSFRGQTIHGADPLPKTKAELTILKRFEPRWAYIDSIPNEIGNLVNLEVIRCGSENIKKIPNSIYLLRHLKELDLNCCGLENISPEIKNLQSLEIFNISQCDRINYLPNELFMLKNLKILDLSFTKINSIPIEIINLTSLEILKIYSCENIKHLPIEIEQMPNLKEITVIPSCLDTFKKFLPNKPHLINFPI